MPSAVLVLILFLSAIAAVLAGMAVFSNNRPPDARLNQVLEDLDELKEALQGIQKQVLQMERKMDKDTKDTRTELRDSVERITERLERKINEAMG